MTTPQIKERFLRWIAVPALAAVLVGLAILQYRWSGQVSDATRAQMVSSLHNSLMGFRQDFARELGAVAIEIRSMAESPAATKPADLKEQFHRWQQTAAHPKLISHIYLWKDAAHQEPLRFDPAANEMERMAWPAEFGQLQQRLLEITSAHHPPAGGPDSAMMRGGGRRRSEFHHHNFNPERRQNAGMGLAMHERMADMMIPWAVDQTIPALAYPIRRRTGPGGSGGPPEIVWLVIQFDPTILQKEIFPELAQKFFGSSSGMDYYIAVRAADSDGERIFYSSGAGFGEEKNLPVDATLNLIGPPFGHTGTQDAGLDFFAAPMRQMAGDHAPQSDEQHLAALERLPRFEPFHYGAGQAQATWQLVAKHKSGSVEAAVSALRRRNLIASFGVLSVLAVTMGLILMASQRARRLAKLQMDFVAGISHELRTPLAVISSAAENIAHGVVEDKQQLVRYGNTIVKQSRQLTQLVEQVLLFASTQQSQGQYGLGPLNIAEVIDAALEGTSATVAAAGFTLERHVEPALPPVKGDFTALVRSLQNLVTNAVKYGGDSRWLRVSATSVKDKGRFAEIQLAVEDRGIGIDKEEIKHIFEPFYRSPAVNASGIHGTGLGLPLARNIVEGMGGKLTASSELGKGSSFVIHLPAATERALQETAAVDKPTGAEPDFS